MLLSSRQDRLVPQLLLSSDENCKMAKKGGGVSAKLYPLQCIFCVQDSKYKQKSKVQELPAWVRKVLDIRRPEHNQVKF